MAVIRNRNRLVSFRLSQQEYNQLCSVCVSEGVASISEFARSAVLRGVETRGSKHLSLGDDLTALGWTLEELDGALGELRQRINRILGSGRKTTETAQMTETAQTK